MISPEFVIDVGRRAVEMILLLSSPMLVCAVLVGLLVSIFQATTQINEQTMTFVPKIVAVLVALLVCAPWIIRNLVEFTREMIASIATLGG
ncbi:MAG TPA: flagellar biosynthesis protein FliQ [Desulfomicrobiaceae bacterium]|nr:flagellar biosynthesis protein FliQ [Desulfomicrobiaceae bacterium]